MLNGFISLDEYWSKNKLSVSQWIQVKLVVAIILLLKLVYRPIYRLKNGKYSPLQGLDADTNLEIQSRGSKRQEKDGEEYLSESEVRDFEKKGILPKFRVLSTEEAHELAKYSYELHDREFDGQVVLGKDVIDALKESGQDNINYMGMFQSLHYQKLWDVLTRPQITQRLKSLLGDDLLCWRSQFFEKNPKDAGTFWHQAGTFRVSSEKPKLEPTEPMGEGIVQLTCWIALKDATIENGCLRLLEGTHTDGRLEKIAYNIIDNTLPFLMEQSSKNIELLFKTMKFTSGSFLKAQLIYDIAMELIPDLFKDAKVTDLELKAGEAIIFSSLNVHGSYPNVTDDTRLAFAGRFTSNNVKVYNGFTYDWFQTPKGPMKFDLDKIACMQVAGEDKFGFNTIRSKATDS